MPRTLLACESLNELEAAAFHVWLIMRDWRPPNENLLDVSCRFNALNLLKLNLCESSTFLNKKSLAGSGTKTSHSMSSFICPLGISIFPRILSTFLLHHVTKNVAEHFIVIVWWISKKKSPQTCITVHDYSSEVRRIKSTRTTRQKLAKHSKFEFNKNKTKFRDGLRVLSQKNYFLVSQAKVMFYLTAKF